MNSAQIQFQLGMTALSRNQVREALAAFERTAQLAPRAAPAHHMVGIALQRLGRLPEADRAITRAIELDRNEPDFLSNRSLVRCGMQQNSAAIADAEAALRLAPTHVGALCNLGLALIARPLHKDSRVGL
jgi:Tfp pilus assembly protein PilF